MTAIGQQGRTYLRAWRVSQVIFSSFPLYFIYFSWTYNCPWLLQHSTTEKELLLSAVLVYKQVGVTVGALITTDTSLLLLPNTTEFKVWTVKLVFAFSSLTKFYDAVHCMLWVPLESSINARVRSHRPTQEEEEVSRDGVVSNLLIFCKQKNKT